MAAHTAARQRLGFWLGVFGMVLFSVTVPATRLATGSDADPQLSPWFVTAGRAALAGLLSLAFLLWTRSPWPARHQWRPLLLALLGNVLLWPLLAALALRSVTAVHAAVIVAVIPLATAVFAAIVLHERERLGFWLCALLGVALVVVFSLIRAGSEGGFGFAAADILLAGAVLASSFGYVYGAQVTPELGAERVICWMCALALPASLPLALWLWPEGPALTAVGWPAWAGLVYVGAVSMWSGFFAWFRGLQWGGTLRVSQVLLLQPFLAMVFAVPLLGESIDALSLGFALAVVVTVFLGRRFSGAARPARIEAQ
ncbi:DMT family transporter [Comamonas sp. NLF-1-9]|uniref:DMT family transporter n=1 Tax=Comamonas sp. NLF-1-9 TaxID=2853163 RepID=UPI001C492DFB|nr:DMT family transporter [Comamonas sp. NLF-1-9]QXL84989.1 DMT family transporter [Comamonas sp. NLF-1-9]